MSHFDAKLNKVLVENFMTLKEKLLDLDYVVDNEYLNKYIELIESNRDTKKVRFLTQTHHIVPIHYFKHHNLTVDNSSENKVELNISKHILAHYYLMKCSSTTESELANANAVFKITTNLHIHTNDYENWIDNNQLLLQKINRRRCELISINHADVTGNKNPTAKKVYEYNSSGECIKIFDTIKECSLSLQVNFDGLRNMLSNKDIYLKNNRILSKRDNVSLKEILLVLNKKKELASHKRYSYMFTCNACGKKYSRLLNTTNYNKIKNKNHYCPDCSQDGSMFRGKSHTDIHKNRISKSRLGQKWIHNANEELQVNCDALENYLNNGYSLGQCKRVKIIKNNEIKRVSILKIKEYLKKGWLIYEN